jgi:predicted double-glycine peptidase
MIDLPSGRQTFDFDCGAKALQLVMAYYGVELREDELMRDLRCDTDGASVERMILVATQRGFQVCARYDSSVEEVKHLADAKTPVIVLVQAWAERYMTIRDWERDNDDGHYVVVIGHSGQIIIFEDPSSFRNTWLTEEEFIARWHDIDPKTGRAINRFAMVLRGKEPRKSTLEHMD